MRGAFALAVIASAIRVAAGSDPDFDKVELLLHCDGADGGSTFTDSSSNARHVTPLFVTTEAESPKFGAAAAYFILGKLEWDNTPFVMTGDFCWEFEYNPTTHPTSGTGAASMFMLFHQRNGSDSTRVFLGYADWTGITSGPGLWFQIDSGGSAVQLVANGALSTTAYSHIAVTRSGNVFRLFVNGVKVDEDTVSITYPNPGGNLVIGQGWGGNFAQPVGARMDEIRVTKGAARYTADFTRPTAPHPDTGPA
jgi:hypothetical protein